MNINQTIKNLERKGYQVSFFNTSKEAVAYLDGHIDNKTVGFGDSATLEEIDLYDKLSSHNDVFSPAHYRMNLNFIQCAKICLTTPLYFTSVNAMSETGELVNIDGVGNRVAGSLFGHDKVYFVIGTNKIAPTLEDAIWRAKNIAAPKNANRLNLRTPCARKADKCYDCSSPDRICNAMVIHYQKMRAMNMEVVIIDEALGF